MAEQNVGKAGNIASATSLPTILPDGWRRCRHVARSGTSITARPSLTMVVFLDLMNWRLFVVRVVF
jgi:hypothetical protein